MSRDLTGKTLEQAVGRVQQMLDPASTVTYREKILNRLGIPREFDVIVRGEFAGHPMVAVIECKDWSDRVGTPELDAFITKARDINCNLRMMVSPKGFTEPALVQARDAGIGVFSLLPDDPNDTGFSVGLLWYAHVYSWTPPQCEIQFQGKSPSAGSFTAYDILFRGSPVLNIMKREISRNHSQSSDMRSLRIISEIEVPIRVHIFGIPYNISRMTVQCDRTYQKMCKFIQMTGEALYDWETRSTKIPAGASISMNGFTADMSQWEPYDGEIPEEAGVAPYQILMHRYLSWSEDEIGEVPVIPNLKLLCERYTAQSS